MKTVKQITLAAAAIALGTSAYGQQLIAGWDFSAYVGSTFNSIDGVTLSGNLPSNFSDFNDPSPNANTTFGTLYYDGQFGSDSISTPTSTPADDEVLPITGNLTSVQVQAADGLGFNISGPTLQAFGQAFDNVLSLGIENSFSGNSITFFATTTGSAFVGANDWELNFASKTESSTATINWEYSTDGVNFSNVGITGGTSNITTTDTGFNVDFGALLDGADDVYIRATSTNTTRILLDNVGITATPTMVPEPSAFAGILGLVALVAARRRA